MTKQIEFSIPTKVLVNNNFEALRTGDFVEASQDDGEFILTPESSFSVSTLYEISKANKLGVKKARANEKGAMLEAILVEIGKLGLTEQNKMTDTQIAAKIVAEGMAKQADDEEILITLVQEGGFKFKEAMKVFQRAMQDGGFRITTKQRREEIHGILKDAAFSPQTYADVEAMIDHLTNSVKDTEANQAAAILRGWAKSNEITLPKPVKRSAGSLRLRVLGWILENRPSTKQELHQAIFELSNGKKDDAKLTENMWTFVEFGENFLNKYRDNVESEAAA